MRHSSPESAAKSRVAQEKEETQLTLVNLSVVLTFDVHWIYFLLAAAGCISPKKSISFVNEERKEGNILIHHRPTRDWIWGRGPKWHAVSSTESVWCQWEGRGKGQLMLEEGQRQGISPDSLFPPEQKHLYSLLIWNCEDMYFASTYGQVHIFKRVFKCAVSKFFLSLVENMISVACMIVFCSPLWII